MEAIGRELGISKPTVCRHLQRARRRLERSLTTAQLAGTCWAGAVESRLGLCYNRPS